MAAESPTPPSPAYGSEPGPGSWRLHAHRLECLGLVAGHKGVHNAARMPKVLKLLGEQEALGLDDTERFLLMLCGVVAALGRFVAAGVER